MGERIFSFDLGFGGILYVSLLSFYLISINSASIFFRIGFTLLFWRVYQLVSQKQNAQLYCEEKNPDIKRNYPVTGSK